MEPSVRIKPAMPNPGIYRVQLGDTFEKIARKHGTSFRALKELNDLSDTTSIMIGQRLKVPIE